MDQSPFLEVDLNMDGEVHNLSTSLVGSYNLQNILLAAGVGVQFGIPDKSITGAIESYVPENQRSQFMEGDRNQLILDSYNANPSSMREAINGLIECASSPTMLILGDMAELGDSSQDEHIELVRWIESLPIDKILLVGPIFSKVCEPSSNLSIFKERSDLEVYLDDTKPEGYIILIKGSRVMELEKILKHLVSS